MSEKQQNSLENDEEIQRANIRQNLSTLSFEELLKLKDTVGAKVYNETVFGAPQPKPKPVVKRENKNRPREVSSKIRLKHLKAILNPGLGAASVTAESKDPRFDPNIGEFDKETFKANYSFINDLRKEEKLQLEKELIECTDSERRKAIKLLIQRIDNQMREEDKTNKIKLRDQNERRENRAKLKQGDKPIYKPKSVKRLENLVEKYEELKKTNRLEKHLQKRAKKLKVKDRKVMEKIKQ